MSGRHNVTVLYGEKGLQKTLSFPSSFTLADVKAVASKEILVHPRRLPGVPPTITLDDTCTDIYPGSMPDTKIGDLGESITIVVWPKGNTTTPSPIMDVLRSATAELIGARSWLNAAHLFVQGSNSKKSKSKQKGLSSTHPSAKAASDSAPVDDSYILEHLSIMQTRIEALEAENAQLRLCEQKMRNSGWRM
ncbi:hypothetical protein BD779DRAFT_1676824 [Infundibulicybe gibba]|nr:hypothetical protein BD779DRAFT_1676824 [Infundibulicybe gibba]